MRSSTILGCVPRHVPECVTAPSGWPAHSSTRRPRIRRLVVRIPAPLSSRTQEPPMPVPATAASRGRSGGWFADRPIGVKIGAAVAVLAVVAVAMTVLAVSRIGALNAAASRINDNVVTLADLADIQRSWQGDRSRFNTYPLADPQSRAALLADLAERRETIEGQLDAYAEVTVNKEAFEVFRGHVEEYYAVADGQLVPASDAGDLATATALITGPLQDSSDKLMDEYNAMQERRWAAGPAGPANARRVGGGRASTPPRLAA